VKNEEAVNLTIWLPSSTIWFIHTSMTLQHFFWSSILLQFRNLLYTNGWSPWTSDQPITRPLPTYRTTQTQTSMPWVGFEPTIPPFKQAKTVHALDCASTSQAPPQNQKCQCLLGVNAVAQKHTHYFLKSPSNNSRYRPHESLFLPLTTVISHLMSSTENNAENNQLTASQSLQLWHF
jgi:hypothetical protein